MFSGRQRGLSLSELQKRMIWHLRVYGPTARSQLAAALGQSNAAITRFSRELINLGLIREEEGLNTRIKGRPMVPLGISGDGAFAAGATYHPGWLEVMLVDFAGTVLARDSLPFESKSPRDFALAVDKRLTMLAARLGLTQRRFLGLGVAVPGYLVGAEERRAVVPWLAGWRNQPLIPLFSDILDMPIWIENDATAAALAEYYQERIVRNHRTILMLFLGHGLGGGIVAERELYRGEYGNAGEIGRLFPLSPQRPSGIDLIGTLRGHGIDIKDLRGLQSLLLLHPTLFEQWMDRVARQIAPVIAAGTAWLDPGAIVISGALPPELPAGIAARLQDWEKNDYAAPRPRIIASELCSSAVCIGAGLVPIHAQTSRR
jgi:predicted NBD/HSP70 family sugar kinase